MNSLLYGRLDSGRTWDLSKGIVEVKGVVIVRLNGSGSTLIACEQTGRTCYGMEIDPGYVDVIIERWENLTGQKAVKIA